MDEWLLDWFDGDWRLMRQRARELWWCGWTAVMFGAVPFVLMWNIADLPREALIFGLVSSIPAWAPAAALILLYVGLMLAVCGWYISRLGKRLQNQM
ncbi:hypothetical protein J2W32_004450 [Variovorax boronicumulans]|uniref:Uncharacterized protein n=1 Tax=Variovorax boronicumulans TaxID=436515 RepID=A0AAW8D2S3_9BURK|nr:hypothetical protein [Variovorax boronicumulans]MDP9895352.1 hypothetical protein [Variovorax boronicumulans]MDQ0055392.1 hypothetical protein [Variovorax boronicumulans]